LNILLTGANGYIGRRLLSELAQGNHKVYCLVRDPRRFIVPNGLQKNITVLKGDLLKNESLSEIPKNLDAAYYLVHSMASSKTFQEDEEKSACNFVHTLKNTYAKQIIFLGGISNDVNLSMHLKSRLNVEKILGSGGIPLTVLRAAIIIGSGSASFEILRDLVEKLPVMITPKWVNVKCQPIAIRDVLKYLIGVLLNKDTFNKIFDIGGKDVLTYKEMMLAYAKIRKLKRLLIDVPVLSPKLSSYWLYFVTSTSFQLAKTLVQSLKNEVVCKNDDIRKFLPFETLGYEDALKLALAKIDKDDIASSWIDSAVSGNININFIDNIKVPEYGCVFDKQTIEFTLDPEKVKNNLWHIGGNRGWYYMNWAWGIRGFLDKLVGGVGLRRGRRNPSELLPGDALDFWRVLAADKISGRLLLFAEMKMPGEAWLEFQILNKNNKSYLKQTATFRPKGLLGRLYWYSLLPFHILIFRNMAKGIINYNT
jgi:uncharacterized protein YbjT (DUF2867 family)